MNPLATIQKAPAQDISPKKATAADNRFAEACVLSSLLSLTCSCAGIAVDLGEHLFEIIERVVQQLTFESCC